MTNFNLRIDDDIITAIDADIETLMPRRSRNSHIENLLYEAYRSQVDKLKADRREREARQATEAPDAQLAGAAG